MTTRNRDTGRARLPGLPPVSVNDPAMRAWMQAVNERLEVREGSRGNPAERAVTYRELESALKGTSTATQSARWIDKYNSVGELAADIAKTPMHTDLLRRINQQSNTAVVGGTVIGGTTVINAGGGSGTAERQFLSVKDYGATGNGSTDDSAAIQAAINAAKTANKSVYFPEGTYLISTLGVQSGRLFMFGTGNATLKGTFTYQENAFPTSADTATPLTPTAPYFSATGLNFESVGTGYALQLFSTEQPNFISTFALSGCRFYGNKGLYAKHMIGFELTHCEFNNKVAGARFESCTNGLFVSCRWQNQAESGVWITRASDQALRSPGGENLKFVLCEWAVCTYGIVADQHLWMTMESCLLDYCAVPLFLSGSKYSKASNTYFGVSNTAVSRFSGVSGYLDPVVQHVAVYGRPSGTPVGTRTVGFTAHNCEFVCYNSGANQPVVYIDGYVSDTYPQSAEHVSFYDCLFHMDQSHSATSLLEISNAQVVRVVGNRFSSFNKSSSITEIYRMNSCVSSFGYGNDFHQVRQSNVIPPRSFETPLAGVYVQASDPGAKGAGTIWIQP